MLFLLQKLRASKTIGRWSIITTKQGAVKKCFGCFVIRVSSTKKCSNFAKTAAGYIPNVSLKVSDVPVSMHQ
jgi:hypothetical protein